MRGAAMGSEWEMRGMTNPRFIPRFAAVTHSAKFETGKVESSMLVEILQIISPFVFDADVGARSPTWRPAVMKPKTFCRRRLALPSHGTTN
jgi:hypothetical protein